MAEKIVLKTDSAEQSRDLGRKIGDKIKSPVLILLKGELGTGKTILAKGIAESLGYKDELTSPTYNLVQEYQADQEIIHMDLYRLDNSEELLEIGFEDYLSRDAVILIEWPEIAFSIIPADFIYIEIIKTSADTREIMLKGEGEDAEIFIERLKKDADFGS